MCVPSKGHTSSMRSQKEITRNAAYMYLFPFSSALAGALHKNLRFRLLPAY